MAAVRLTYCGNVHAAASFAEWLDGLDRFTVPLAADRRAAGFEFGLGGWLPASVVDELVEVDGASRLADELASRSLEPWTMNVFPHGDFHGERVKELVYRPDWADEERVRYTRRVAELFAPLGPPDEPFALSTLPLGFDDGSTTDEQRRRMARNLVRAASHLEDLSDRVGRDVVLAVEPEPCCLVETVDATIEFLEHWVFRDGAWPTVGVDVLRRRIGVCVDLCHLAVLGEDPIDAARALAAHGIRVPKIQVSSGLELRDPAGLDELLAFDEPRYLHQTVAAGRSPRALDLDDVAARRDEFARAPQPVRTHFHVPFFWDAATPSAPLGSTRGDAERALLEWPEPLPLLEVETYTWSVLDPEWRPERDLVRGLGRELATVDELLARRAAAGIP